MSRIPAMTAVIVACVLLSSGCAEIRNLTGAGADPDAKARPPAAAPALAPAEARAVVAAWAGDFNRAAKRYDVGALRELETGALLEEHRTEFRIRRFNDRPVPLRRGVSDLAIPRFVGWPRWFTAGVTVRAKTPEVHHTVFVQRARGGAWRAASAAVLDRELVTSMGRYVVAPADARVVPAGDTSLSIAPNRLAAAHAHALRYGYASPHAKLFGGTADVGGASTALMRAHRRFKSHGWTGRTTVAPAPHPMYVLRTPSTGAVAIYAVDQKSVYRRVKGDVAFSSRIRGLGQLLPAMIGSEYAPHGLTEVLRTEYVAYVPRRNTSEIQILATRLTVVSASGF